MSTGARTAAMDSWESLMASRMRPCATMPKEEDTSKRAKKIGSDRYEKSEKRKATQVQGRSQGQKEPAHVGLESSRMNKN